MFSFEELSQPLLHQQFRIAVCNEIWQFANLHITMPLIELPRSRVEGRNAQIHMAAIGALSLRKFQKLRPNSSAAQFSLDGDYGDVRTSQEPPRVKQHKANRTGSLADE